MKLTTTTRKGLLVLAQFALHKTQKTLGEALGVSMRTMSRWQGGRTAPGPDVYVKLARMVYPHDKELAAQLAQTAGTTVDALGLVPPPPPPAPAPPPLPSKPAPLLRHLVDSVVCAAGAAVDVPIRDLRRAHVASLTRAKELGLNVDELLAGLVEEAKPKRGSAARA
jgi:hypothetical protein